MNEQFARAATNRKDLHAAVLKVTGADAAQFPVEQSLLTMTIADKLETVAVSCGTALAFVQAGPDGQAVYVVDGGNGTKQFVDFTGAKIVTQTGNLDGHFNFQSTPVFTVASTVEHPVAHRAAGAIAAGIGMLMERAFK